MHIFRWSTDDSAAIVTNHDRALDEDRVRYQNSEPFQATQLSRFQFEMFGNRFANAHQGRRIHFQSLQYQLEFGHGRHIIYIKANPDLSTSLLDDFQGLPAFRTTRIVPDLEHLFSEVRNWPEIAVYDASDRLGLMRNPARIRRHEYP